MEGDGGEEITELETSIMEEELTTMSELGDVGDDHEDETEDDGFLSQTVFQQ